MTLGNNNNHRNHSTSASLRPRVTRCKTGCLCCRLRKKKCDGQRPVCLTCTRLGLLCSWPTSNEFAWRIRMGLNVAKSTAVPSLEAVKSSPSESDSTDDQSLALASSTQHLTLIPNPSCPAAGNVSDAASHQLLCLYIDRTAPLLISLPKGSPNPFLQDVIPLAFSDTLIMNALLNVGGFELDMTATSGKVEAKRLQCYGAAIKELNLALAEWSAGVRQDPTRLLLATLLLCLHECLSGNEGGTLLHHLRACRYFAQAVLDAQHNNYSADLTGTLLENYAYYEMCANLRILVGPNDIGAACYFSVVHLNDLRHYRTFGSYFGCSSALYQTIPFICQLAVDRQAELTGGCDLGCHQSFALLKNTLEQWQHYSTTPSNQPQEVLDTDNMPRIMASNVVRNALLLFLYSSYYQDPLYVRKLAQPIVEESIEILPILIKTPWTNTIFWPAVVLATYAVTPLQQDRFLSLWPRGIPLVARAIKMLRWIWNSADDVYGLEGLAKVIKDHDTNILFG